VHDEEFKEICDQYQHVHDAPFGVDQTVSKNTDNAFDCKSSKEFRPLVLFDDCDHRRHFDCIDLSHSSARCI